MASITVRNLDDNVKRRLRRQAAENGRSLEAEVREILARNASAPKPSRTGTGLDLVQDLRAFVKKYGGVELDIPPRGPMRRFDEHQEVSPALLLAEGKSRFRRKK